MYRFQNYSDYLRPQFTQHLAKENINCIFELGARDGFDAIALQQYFNAQVYSFECNPNMLEVCRQQLEQHYPQIQLFESAVWNETKSINFYSVTSTIRQGRQIRPNVGASSCFLARDDYLEQNIQDSVTVNAIRLDEFCIQKNINKIDLLCVDVQGACLHALAGMGNMLNNTQYVIAEIERKPLYHDQMLFQETNTYLKSHNFILLEEVYRDDWFSDYLYCRD